MKLKAFFILLLLIICGSAFAALFGLGLSYHRVIGPTSSLGELSLISGDAWVQDGASIQFYNLASRGNQLKLSMKGWRPQARPKAQYEVSVCGNVATRFEDDGKRQNTVYLTGDCEPRKADFHVLNPFRSGADDQRPLGSQLQSARVTSLLGVPIVKPSILLKTGAAIAVLSLLLLALFWGSEKVYLSLLAPPLSLILLMNAEYLEYEKLFPLWLLCVGVIGGMLFVPYIGERTILHGLSGRKKYQEQEALWPLFVLAIITAVGAAYRFYGINYGLPQNFHPDEVPKVNAIMRMVHSGTLNPNYFLHPSLLLYCTYLMNTILHLFGMPGDFRETAFLAGRLVSAIAGILSIVLVYFIGKRLYVSASGLFGAALLAVSPLHIACSRYLKEDALLTFFVLASLLALIISVQAGRRRYLLLAALLAGCSASVKYSGILTVGLLCAAPWLRSKDLRPDMDFLKAAFFAGFLAPLAFVICSPYTVVNITKFYHDFGAEGHHMLRGHTNPVSAWSQYWMYHLKRSIFPGMGFFPSMCALLGLGVLLWRRRTEDLFVLFVLLLYYLPAEWVKAKPAPQPERYILPCLPMLAVMAGEFLRMLYASKHRGVAFLVILITLFMPAWRSGTLAYEIRHDTRNLSADWMRENIPHDAKLFLDWKRYCPEFRHKEFEVTYIPRAEILLKLDLKALQDADEDYLVLSSLFYDRYFTDPESPPAPRNIFRAIFEKLPVVAEFAPRFGTYGFHNPVITVFSLKDQDIERLRAELEQKEKGLIQKTSNEEKSSMYWKKKKHWMFLDFQYFWP